MSETSELPIDSSPLNDSPFAFGREFLDDHAGQIIVDPTVALIELLANAYDAGATRVNVAWPERSGDPFVIDDNGAGMTTEKFHLRWKALKYNRLLDQGVTKVPRVLSAGSL